MVCLLKCITFALRNSLSFTIKNNKNMSIKVKNQMSEIMTAAWSFVHKNGYTMAEALKCAWANFKLRKAMATKIVRFYFRKVDGSIREAFGTLAENTNITPITTRNNTTSVRILSGAAI